MYVQEQAAEGGESHLASCAKIYNEIAATRPDVIHTLAAPNWIFDKYAHFLPPSRVITSTLGSNVVRADIKSLPIGIKEAFSSISRPRVLDSASRGELGSLQNALRHFTDEPN